MMKDGREWDDLLGFWFPEAHLRDLDAATNRAHWHWRMQSGADQQIMARFTKMTEEAARGGLDHWAQDPQGRLALIVLLDQFPRSVWRGEARAYAQDRDALSLTIKGLSNGHYTALAAPWAKITYGLPLGHCEGPGHLQRLDQLISLRKDIAAQAPIALRPVYLSLIDQACDVRRIISAFGRHPHRNAVLSRPSTPAEKAYLMRGQFPHLRAFRPAPDESA